MARQKMNWGKIAITGGLFVGGVYALNSFFKSRAEAAEVTAATAETVKQRVAEGRRPGNVFR